MHTVVRFEPADVETALARLGLDLLLLMEAGRLGLLAWATCTPNDPPMLGGLMHWARVVRALRDHLLPRGWTKSDDDNYSLVIGTTARYAIAVSSGCPNTGMARATPTTNCPKGPSTAGAISVNHAQLELFPDIKKTKVPKAPITWLFLFHRDAKEIRLELSLPSSIGENGYIDGWNERILLPTIPLDPALVVAPPPDFGPDIDVEIRRRA